MAFLSRVGNILRQTASRQIASESSLSRPSIYQALRCMSSSKLFVGGISYATDDTSLREAFSKYGEVAEARVITDRETGRSRGFGFITFTDSEAASSAIQAMDGQELHGRRVRVNYANDRARGGGGYGGGGYGGGGYGGDSGYGGGGYGGGGYNSNYGGGGYNSNYGSSGNSFDSGSTGSYGNQPSYGVAAGGGGNDGGSGNDGGTFNLDGQDWAPSTRGGDHGFDSSDTGAEGVADNDSSEDADEKYDQDGTFGRK